MEFPEYILLEYHPMADVETFDAVKRRLYTIASCEKDQDLAVFLDTDPPE